MSSTGSKRRFDDMMLAGSFLKDECNVDDELLRMVPTDGTVRDIRQCILYEEKNWVGDLPLKVYKLALDILANSATFEEILHAERIKYCGFGYQEYMPQQQIKQLIECNISGHHVSDEVGTNRNCSISLVLGSSGSGKTTYCVNELGKSDPCVFRVYMYADHILGKDNNDISIKEFRLVLREAIQNVLKIASLDRKLKMAIYAIIDEAGGNTFFGNKKSLENLKEVIDEVAENGRLVVSGTGLDLLTKDIGSTGEGITKIRMLPWKLSHFEKLLTLPSGNSDRLVSLVKKHDIYTKMISNARAAAWLSYWLERTLSWGNDDDNVAHVVRAVAYDYIAGNGLKDLKANSRRKVVRSILTVLHKCEYDSTTIPDFCSLSTDERRRAQSMVDIHVEKSGGTFMLERGHYAVSVTPAIAVVLAAMLNNTATLQTSWSGFETIVALDELFNLVREETADDMPEFQILHLDKPYDARANSQNLEVPVMSRSMVLVNGSKAAYADVIAPFRLIQVKHCKSGQSSAKLRIRDELMKMGLLKASSIAQKVFAMAQYEIWKSSEDTSTSTTGHTQQHDQSTDQEQQQATMPAAVVHRTLYPASLLVSEMEKKKPASCLMYKAHKEGTGAVEKWYRMSASTDSDFCHAVDPDAVARETKPVTVVFVTNGSSFTISQQVGTGSSYIDILTIFESCILFDAGQGTHVLCTEWMKSLLKEELVTGVIVKLAFARC